MAAQKTLDGSDEVFASCRKVDFAKLSKELTSLIRRNRSLVSFTEERQRPSKKSGSAILAFGHGRPFVVVSSSVAIDLRLVSGLCG